MTDLKHFPRIIGREYQRKRSTKVMLIITSIIVLALLLIISAVKGHEQAEVKKARAEERRHILAPWDSIVLPEIRYRANREIAGGVK